MANMIWVCGHRRRSARRLLRQGTTERVCKPQNPHPLGSPLDCQDSCRDCQSAMSLEAEFRE